MGEGRRAKPMTQGELFSVLDAVSQGKTVGEAIRTTGLKRDRKTICAAYQASKGLWAQREQTGKWAITDAEVQQMAERLSGFGVIERRVRDLAWQLKVWEEQRQVRLGAALSVPRTDEVWVWARQRHMDDLVGLASTLREELSVPSLADLARDFGDAVDRGGSPSLEPSPRRAKDLPLYQPLVDHLTRHVLQDQLDRLDEGEVATCGRPGGCFPPCRKRWRKGLELIWS